MLIFSWSRKNEALSFDGLHSPHSLGQTSQPTHSQHSKRQASPLATYPYYSPTEGAVLKIERYAQRLTQG